MEKNIDVVLFTQEEIQAKVKEMAVKISSEYKDKSIICVGLLKGAFVFTSDLCRHLTVPYQVDFMAVSSYGSSTESSGNVKIKKDIDIDPKGKHVLIIEDLIDTGNTLHWIQKHITSKDCASVKIVCLLDKTSRRTSPVKVDYIGWEIPDEFVIGYGMDFSENYRALPFVGVLKREAYAK